MRPFNFEMRVPNVAAGLPEVHTAPHLASVFLQHREESQPGAAAGLRWQLLDGTDLGVEVPSCGARQPFPGWVPGRRAEMKVTPRRRCPIDRCCLCSLEMPGGKLEVKGRTSPYLPRPAQVIPGRGLGLRIRGNPKNRHDRTDTRRDLPNEQERRLRACTPPPSC